jgi:hypothetical protein
MTDYAEFLTEIDRLRREIHDACKAGKWEQAMNAADRLKADAHALRVHCYDKSKGAH